MKDTIRRDILPAYPFVQYNDDPYVVAFFDAYNAMAQAYLDAFRELALPYWPSPRLTGYLLDWAAQGIYGQHRPAQQLVHWQKEDGPYNTVEYDQIPYAHLSNFVNGQYAFMNDDIFKRVLTWNFYKGDGFQFSVPWLKRRIARFIHGKDGHAPPLTDTFDVSVTVNKGLFTLVIPDYGDGVADELKGAIQQGFVKLPFMYRFETEFRRCDETRIWQ